MELSEQRWELYKLLGEPSRLRLLRLSSEEELAIGELSELLGEAQPNVSRNVGALRRAGMVAVRRQGTRALVRLAPGVDKDPVIADALDAGDRLCREDGSLSRVATVVGARDMATREYFRHAGIADALSFPAELPAYLSALALLIERRSLAIDAGTGDGRLLDVVAPIYETVIAVDREDVQLTAAKERVAHRGYENVGFVQGEIDEPGFVRDIQSRGGADAVFASRVLHHAPKPDAQVRALAELLAPGGVLLIVDYAPHQDDNLRQEQADLWLGFDPGELEGFARAAKLERVTVGQIPAARCGNGRDGHLDWQVLCARKPLEGIN